jgi:GH15 family glucan-1,4-alpha-glucosidase
MPLPIEDYALIGDCETAALVGRDGSIDWLCLPRFDSDACFAALLGTPDNGRWQIRPRAKAKITRRYRPGTLILETQFTTSTGSATVIDFMPVRKDHPAIFRIVRGDRGLVPMHIDLVIRFDYGRIVPWVSQGQNKTLRAIVGPHLLTFRSSIPVRGKDLRTVGDFTVKAGHYVDFHMQYSNSVDRVPPPLKPQASLRQAEKLWRKWTARCKYRGPYKEAVERSLITLKALTHHVTGGVLAAATTSLPEQPRGQRNWDYRFCWLRDATFTLLALLHAGYRKEASQWRDWLARTVAGSPEQIQPLYGLGGERRLLEWEVPWLCGYQGATPVRVGNAAADQIQLDLYGEIADVLHLARIFDPQKDGSDFRLQIILLERLEKLWRKPDSGIWEVRGPQKHFTHSKVMAWLAFDRAIRSGEKFHLRGPLKKWRSIRDQIHRQVCRRGFNRKLGAFVQSYGSKEMDASLLMMSLVGFLPPTDKRIIGTVQQIEKQLVRDGLVLRYRTQKVDDGLPPGEGVFLACSFWLADNYELMGRHEDAVVMLERLLNLRNDVGLLSEEYHLGAKRLVGNFPQAFSHVGMVNTIINVFTDRGPAHQRSHRNHNHASHGASKTGLPLT